MYNPLAKKQTYDTIVSPLKKILNDLNAYIENQRAKITDLEFTKQEINNSIKTSENEIQKSNTTVEKLSDLVITE